MSTLTIRRVPTFAAADEALCASIAQVINNAYREGEAGLWISGAARTSGTEVTDFIRNGEVIVAEREGAVVGCVRLMGIEPGVAEFGMLSTELAVQGTGIGSALLRFTECAAVKAGFRELQLEILCPRGWLHPRKEHLKAWYGRCGYVFRACGSIETAYPQLAPLLSGPCDFLIHRKEL